MTPPEWARLSPLIGSAVVAIIGATILGNFLSKWMGTVVLAVLTTAASAICLLGARRWYWPGLIGGMVLVTLLAYIVGHLFSGKRGALLVSSMWLIPCMFGLFGYLAAKTFGSQYYDIFGLSGDLAAQTIGLVFIMLPHVALLWIGAYVLSQRLLPLRDGASREECLKAFRALLTYTLGTNYPYYMVENRKATQRVSGGQYRQFFAGPGVIITSCDHAVVITNNISVRRIPDPGLAFTEMYENIADVIDLRFQLRAFDVEAITRDGIRIKVLTFVPFRIDGGDAWPELGKPFPFRRSAIFKATRGQLIERSRDQKDGKVVENRQKRTWDEAVNIVAGQTVRKIIGQYSFDDLCAPYQPQKDPRQDIAKEMRQQLKEKLGPEGIQVVGGGLSNLLPVDDKLLQQRIDNWQAEWERRMTAEMGKGEAEYIRMVESARAQAQAEMIRTISEGFERAGAAENISTEVIALRFIEALEKMIESPQVQQALPPASSETVKAMKHSISIQRH